MSTPTPLLDFFRRGEAPRDAKLQAAAGALVPRPHEQLAILVLLASDSDPEVRTVAQRTLDGLPIEGVVGVLARPDVPVGVREFFADRGVFPAHMPPVGDDTPLLDPGLPDEVEDGREARREPLVQQVAKMGFTDRLKAALKGSREVRAILIRDPNKMIATAVLSSSRITESEGYVRVANVADDVLRSHRHESRVDEELRDCFCPDEEPEDPAGHLVDAHEPAERSRSECIVDRSERPRAAQNRRAPEGRAVVRTVA